MGVQISVQIVLGSLLEWLCIHKEERYLYILDEYCIQAES